MATPAKPPSPLPSADNAPVNANAAPEVSVFTRFAIEKISQRLPSEIEYLLACWGEMKAFKDQMVYDEKAKAFIDAGWLVALPMEVGDRIQQFVFGRKKVLKIKMKLREAQQKNVDTITKRLKDKSKEYLVKVRVFWRKVRDWKTEAGKVFLAKELGVLMQLYPAMYNEVARQLELVVQEKKEKQVQMAAANANVAAVEETGEKTGGRTYLP